MSKNEKVALVYGSDTGSTEFVSDTIAVKLGIKDLVFRDISTMKISDFDDYSILILGIPTWYIGELQTDWDDFFSELKTLYYRIVYGKKSRLAPCNSFHFIYVLNLHGFTKVHTECINVSETAKKKKKFA